MMFSRWGAYSRSGRLMGPRFQPREEMGLSERKFARTCISLSAREISFLSQAILSRQEAISETNSQGLLDRDNSEG